VACTTLIFTAAMMDPTSAGPSRDTLATVLAIVHVVYVAALLGSLLKLIAAKVASGTSSARAALASKLRPSTAAAGDGCCSCCERKVRGGSALSLLLLRRW
jgi:hypothetical protein